MVATDSVMVSRQETPTFSLKKLFALTPEDPYAPLLVVLTALAIIISLALEALDFNPTVVLGVNIFSYVVGGYYGLRAGLESLLEREINVDLLMILAAVGAALVNQWHEGAILLFLFSLSGVLETYAMGRSRRAIHALLELRPTVADVRREGVIVEVRVEDLQTGDIVVLEPGARIPIDGKVVSGTSTVNQASITGESMPVLKQVGDEVFAGTLNENGAMDIRVTRPASESTLARIIALVEEAQDNRAETQRFLDEFEQRYALFVIIAVALLIVIPPVFFGVNFDDNFYRAMVVLVVASPCALVISTPASILSAIANGARQGVLFKGGAYLEKLGDIQAIAFDKTGTLTQGTPQVTDIIVMNGMYEDEFLRLVASAEARSEHPLAEAIVRDAKARNLTLTEPISFEAVPGMGIQAEVEGRRLLIGSPRLLEKFSASVSPEIREQRATLEAQGKTVLLAYDQDHGCLGVVAVADKARTEAIAAIAQLKQIGVAHTAMLTGDNQRVADALGASLKMTDIYAELLPEDKVTIIQELATKYGTVAMIGDGVNDAPALATADIGIAMGAAGTDVALETADVVLMSSDLSRIAYAIGLSKKARRVMLQNITFSIGMMVVLVIAALLPFIEVPLPLGVVGHEGSTLVVVLNGLRLLRYK